MFAGTLKSFSVTNLMQMCYNDNNTGVIEFTKNDTLYGSIGFIKGRMVHAVFLETQGINAVMQLTLLEDLDFKFIARSPEIKPNLKTDINFLLIECSRYMDECAEYIQHLKQLFLPAFPVKNVGFYQYGHSHFAVCDQYQVKYFEVYDHKKMTVVFKDKHIGARIELLFDKKILTNDLAMFMSGKDILE